MMEVMVERCAGIDVHKKTITVCTLVGSLNRSKPKKQTCLLYTSPSPRDRQKSRMPSSA